MGVLWRLCGHVAGERALSAGGAIEGLTAAGCAMQRLGIAGLDVRVPEAQSGVYRDVHAPFVPEP